ncbi:MAG: hypothetical protein JNJ88_19680 [Planctomycetes bacterium]|nr:hypothetical protein [Planctomycetota bacterium]
MGRHVGKLAATAALALALATQVAAATVERIELHGLASRAEQVIEARVQSVNAAADRSGRLATRVELTVLTRLKGKASSSVSFLLPGGARQGEHLVVPGVPKLVPGEEVVIFLSKPSSAGISLPIGLGQGLYRASVDAKSGEKRYTPDLAGLELLDGATGKPVRVAATPVEREQFLAEIRRCVSGR